MDDHFTVFYAWQSDTDRKVNHDFIRDAAQDAIDAVLAELQIEEAPAIEPDPRTSTNEEKDAEEKRAIELDHDTKDEPGTPNIAETIFRKIGDCGVFLADLTYAGEVVVDGNRTKRLPNSNVLIELGQAVASIGWRQIILVQNTHFGDVEFLPFDLRNYSHPIRYTLAPGADKETRKAQRKELAGKLKSKLKIMKKSGVWTKKTEERQKIEAERKKAHRIQVEEERDAFEQKVLQDSFHNFKAERDILALSLIPDMPLNPPIDFKNQICRDTLGQKLFLMHVSFSVLTPASDWLSAIATPSANRFVPPLSVPSYSTAELTNTGSIYAAHDWTALNKSPREVPITYEMGDRQPPVVNAVKSYLELLRELGVKGTIYVGLSLRKAGKIHFNPHRDYRDFGPPMSGSSGKDIVTHLIPVAPTADISTFESVTAILRNALWHFWAEAGFHDGIPVYDAAGKYLNRWDR